MRTFSHLSTALLLACSGKSGTTTADTADTGPLTAQTAETADTGEPQGACGDPILYDLTVIGVVHGPGGVASEGAHVVLEDRVWNAGDILGEGYTDGDGLFVLDVVGLTSLEDCWGLLGYYVEADKGNFYGERGINSELFGAIDRGDLIADLSAFPIEIEEP